jgi:threonine dehydrogenase-like Zn-dependent dehydrogenase
MRDAELVVDEVAVPEPDEGEVLVKTLACGICGSDLHTLKYGRQLMEASEETGGSFVMDLNRDVVMGHEFCAEVLDFGPATERRFQPGDRVCSIPMTVYGGQITAVGYSNDRPGGYAENMLLYEPMLLKVPNGLSTDLAALTEPMAVGYHAVQMSGITADEIPLVIGCGPVGLAVIAALKRRGIAPVIAADFSETRRMLALSMGADAVVDPTVNSPYQSWMEAAASPRSESDPADFLGAATGLRSGVYFECVGVPGVIDQIMTAAPRGTRIVIVGVCMEHDQIRPLVGINKELNLQFVLGYTPEEFAQTLHHIAEGGIDLEPLITGKVGIDGVADAFRALADPEAHAKILVEP